MKCKLCGENPIVETDDYKDRCAECLANTCEKCGGETGARSAGDESYDRCSDCGWLSSK